MKGKNRETKGSRKAPVIRQKQSVTYILVDFAVKKPDTSGRSL